MRKRLAIFSLVGAWFAFATLPGSAATFPKIEPKDGKALATPIESGMTGKTLTTRRVASGLSLPLFVTAPPGDTDRLFIVEQRGSGGVGTRGDIRILNLDTGTINATPFLSVTGLATGNEQGLLGLAFAPDYAVSGRFYVNYTSSGGSGTTRIARGTVSANPNIANPTLEVILSIAQPFTNHNGGWLGFGPDGYLYVATGDGGSANDPGNRAQTITNQLLGKMLRLDVSTATGYAIPPSNPFAGPTTGDDEIWAYGLRNPWRCAFDRETGDLWIADVGQNAWEEINFQPAIITGARNYGWRCMEGLHCTGLTGCTCNSASLTLPIHEYSHSFGCSITGGYVYRGCGIPDLRGTYFFADYCSGTIWSLRYDGTAVSEFTDRTIELTPDVGAINNITSFGEDAAGEMYIVDQTGGEVFKIEAEVPPVDCNNNCVDDATDIANGTSQDCNDNGVPDECDIADGTSADENGNGIPDECETSGPCGDCGPGPHWMDMPLCPAGIDGMPSGALVGVDFDFDCLPDMSLILSGPVQVQRSEAQDDSVFFPGTRPVDGHFDVMDTQIVSMHLTGGGVTLTAGAGNGETPLAPSLGAIAEQTDDVSLADSFFNVFFEVELGGQFAYNQIPLTISAVIDCVPPQTTYSHPEGCIPLFSSPIPGLGFPVANLVTANHSTFPPPPPDPWTTWRDDQQPDQTFQDFSGTPIPADFFGPGSEPFTGRIELAGDQLNLAGLGDADTLIQRSDDPVESSDPPGTIGTVDIQIVELGLKSVDPITVTYDGGTTSELWEVAVDLSAMPQPSGSLTAMKTHDNGGTFDSVLPVQPRFIFTRISDGALRLLDTGLAGIPPVTFTASGTPFVHQVDPAAGVLTQPGATFVPGVEQTIPGDPASQQARPMTEAELLASHTVCPPRRPKPRDPWSTWRAPGQTDANYQDFAAAPIPPDFFDPGSEPFTGRVEFAGNPMDHGTLGETDTLVQRDGDPVSPGDPIGTVGSVSIEIVELNLISIRPITVTYSDGRPPEQWDVSTGLSAVSPGPGILTAMKTHPNGGTFDSTLPVQPRLTFTRRSDAAVRALDTGLAGMPPIMLQATGSPFVHSVNPSLDIVTAPGSTFVPGVEETVPGDMDTQEARPLTEEEMLARHTVCPPRRRTPPPDYWYTVTDDTPDRNYQDISIPDGFFGPTCSGFDGRIEFQGEPFNQAAQGNADTCVHRTSTPVTTADSVGTVGSTDIELTDLNLVSTQPITVMCDGAPTIWEVRAGVSPTTPAPTGTMTATKTHPNGGTFDSTLSVQPLLTFTPLANCHCGDGDGDGDIDLFDHALFVGCLSGPGGGLIQPGCVCFDRDGDGDVDLLDFYDQQNSFGGSPSDLCGSVPAGLSEVALDAGAVGMPPITFQATSVPFVHQPEPSLGLYVPDGSGFVVSVEETLPGETTSQVPQITEEQALLAKHTVCPPRYEPQGIIELEEIIAPAPRGARMFTVTCTWSYVKGVKEIHLTKNGAPVPPSPQACSCDPPMGTCTRVWTPVPVDEGDILTTMVVCCDGVTDDVSTRPIRNNAAPMTWVDYLCVDKITTLQCGTPTVGPMWKVLIGAPKVDPDSLAALLYPVKGTLASDALKDVRLQYEAKDGDGDIGRSIWNVTVVDADLDIIKTVPAGGELPDDKEENPGGYVPLNNDDDDYDGTTRTTFTEDRNDPDDTAGETDLVPLIIHALKPAGVAQANERYKLIFGGNIKIWKQNNRTDAVVSDSTEFPNDMDTTVYVEGINHGGGAAVENVTLRITFSGVTCEDKNKLTVYRVEGPLNVPDRSIHRYNSTINGTWTVEDGAIQAGAATQTITVLWGAGPVTGNVKFRPDDNFELDREINVVEVDIDPPDAGMAFTTGAPVDGGNPVLGGILSKIVRSSATGTVALRWNAKVTLNGPNGDRGVIRMRVGFIQNLTAYRNRGTYNTAGTTLKANIEGLTPLLDHLDGLAGPWYSEAGTAVFFDPAPAGKTKTITSNDTPTDGPPLTADQGGTVAAGDDVLDSMNLQDDFSLDVCANTRDTQQMADRVYTRRATINWRFNGDGTVGQAAPYTWTAGGAAGDTAPAAWTAVTDGSQPARTTGRTFNQELNSIVFAP